MAIAKAFADAGADVAVSGTQASSSDYPTNLARFRYVQCYLRDYEQVEALAEQQTRLDVLVNNAGRTYRGEWSKSDRSFEDTLLVNLSAIHHLSQCVHPKLKAVSGCVVNIGSMYSEYAGASPGYSAAKAGVVNLTKTLAAHWAADGIRVNNVAPGWTETDMTAGLRADPSFEGRVIAHTPLGRWGRPSDVATATLFLASDQAAYITGVTLPVDGGFSAVW